MAKIKKIGAFWKWQSLRILQIPFMLILGNFWQFQSIRRKTCNNKKAKKFYSNFKQFLLYYYGDVYAERSKIAKNRPNSTWVVFSEPYDFAISKIVNFLIFDHLLYSTPAHNSIDFFDPIPFQNHTYYCLWTEKSPVTGGMAFFAFNQAPHELL